MFRDRWLQRSGQLPAAPSQESQEAAAKSNAGQFHQEVSWPELSDEVENRSAENGSAARKEESTQPIVSQAEAEQTEAVPIAEDPPESEPSVGNPGDILATMTGKELNLKQIRNFLRDREIIEKERKKNKGDLLAEGDGELVQ